MWNTSKIFFFVIKRKTIIILNISELNNSEVLSEVILRSTYQNHDLFA